MKEGAPIPNPIEPEVSVEPQEQVHHNTAIKRVVGIPKDAPVSEEQVIARYARDFEHQPFYGCEIMKTMEQLEIIVDVCNMLPDFLKEYGPEHPIQFKPEQIHIIDAENSSYPEERKEVIRKRFKHTPAIWDAGGQYIAIDNNFIKRTSKIEFAHVLAHELIHGFGFASKHVVGKDAEKNKIKLGDRRIGLEFMVNEEDGGGGKQLQSYFTDVNEAVVEELALRFMRVKSTSIKGLEEDIVERKKELEARQTEFSTQAGAPVIVVDNVIGEQVGSGAEVYTREGGAYKKERRELEKANKELYEKNKDRFNSPGDVFRLFTKSYFSGRVLELARIIEATYGKGAFRKAGRKTKRKPYPSN
ncbi:MAG: hypothetical protein RL094_540 [Candidatus Parcubacteria bacterium]|jgi:hypothetical protein